MVLLIGSTGFGETYHCQPVRRQRFRILDDAFQTAHGLRVHGLVCPIKTRSSGQGQLHRDPATGFWGVPSGKGLGGAPQTEWARSKWQGNVIARRDPQMCPSMISVQPNMQTGEP